MYTTEDRAELFDKTMGFINSSELFEGVVQIGSGVVGYRDEYSDIDLMVGCFGKADIPKANAHFITFFKSLGAVYIDKRKWSETNLGVSVYFVNGLSLDISFSPSKELIICSPQWKIILDKTGALTEHIKKDNEEFLKYYSNYGVDNSIHHKFIYALRKCKIALMRENFIFADISLREARQYVLNIQVVNEGKKLHQFKEYDTLNKSFLAELAKTYPAELSFGSVLEAEDILLKLYIKTSSENDKLAFDKTQLVLLNIL